MSFLRSSHHDEGQSREQIPPDLLDNIIDNLDGVIFERDIRGRRDYTFMSKNCEKIFGYTQQEFYADPNITEKFLVNDKVFLEYYKGRAEKGRNIVEFAVCRKDGEIRYIRSIFSSVHENNIIIKYRGIAFDITTEAKNTIRLHEEVSKNELLRKVLKERERAVNDMIQMQDKLQALNLSRTELYQQIKVDSLTGLNNRREFDYQLKFLINLAQQDQRYVSLIMCDVDHFKQYNDELGHYAGDECLIKIARSISNTCTSPSGIVCRYGGEEFSIIIYDACYETTFLAEKIRKNVQRMTIPHPARDNTPVTLSIGYCSVLPDSTVTSKKLIEYADAALYQAKSNGRNNCVQYQQCMPRL